MRLGSAHWPLPVDPLSVPELLISILSFATHSTLASCAIVCKPWSQVALDELWKHLDPVFPLLELMRDVEVQLPDSLKRLSSKLSRANWSLFQSYAGRVSSLSHNYEIPYRGNLRVLSLGAAISMRCVHHPRGPAILPHLDMLSWYTNRPATQMLPFLSPRVTSLDVELKGSVTSVNDFLYALDGRIPNLKSFTLRTPTRALNIEGSLQRAIGTLKTLEALQIPPYYLRPLILEAAASLPDLIHLNQDYTRYRSPGAAATLQELSQDAFPKLETFGLNANLASAKRLLRKYSGLFTRLTKIHLKAEDGVNDAEVLEFVRQLGATCRKATRVSLDLSVDPTLRGEGITPLSVGVPEVLFPCRDLEVLESFILSLSLITITENDVERMAAAWPKIYTTFAMNPIYHFLYMGSSLSILQAFAKHYPMIQELGLFIAKDKALTFSGGLYPEFEFHRLEKIDVGTSAVPAGGLQDAGFLIASLCKLQPEIRVGVSDWYVGVECPEWEEYRRQWEEMVKVLKFAMRVKSVGRERMSGMAN